MAHHQNKSSYVMVYDSLHPIFDSIDFFFVLPDANRFYYVFWYVVMKYSMHSYCSLDFTDVIIMNEFVLGFSELQNNFFSNEAFVKHFL